MVLFRPQPAIALPLTLKFSIEKCSGTGALFNGFPIKKNVDTILREIYTTADNEVGESGRKWEP